MAFYGISLNLPIPQAGAVSWDGPLNALLQAIVNVLAQRVTPTGMNINSSLSMNGNMLVDVSSLEFIPAATDPGTACTVFVAGPGSGLTSGEWYIRDGSNREIQLTSGGYLNLTVNGGFGGQYVAAGAVASYNAGNDTYYFTTNGTIPANINAAAGQFTAITGSSAVFSNYGCGYIGVSLLQADMTGTITTVQSGTVTQWIDVASGLASAGAPSYLTSTGWSLTGSLQAVDVPLNYFQGDQLQQVIYTTNGITTTGTLYFREVNPAGGANTSIIARIYQTGKVAVTMSAGGHTLTGSLPFTPGGPGVPATGSLFFQCGGGPGYIGPDQFCTLQVTWLRKLI